jgi:hypothetical protein
MELVVATAASSNTTVENKSYNKYPGGNVDTGEFDNFIFIKNNL